MAEFQCALPTNTECTTFLTRGQTIVAETGLFSAVAVLLLFGKITRNVMRKLRRYPREEWRFFKSPLDVYMLSLLVSDLLQGVGILLDIKWVVEGSVRCGAYCTTQGVLSQMGETGVALATLAIAVHTFFIIFFRKGAKKVLLASIIVCVMWTYVVIFIAASAAGHNKGQDEFYTPTPYWCWVGARFNDDRIAGEYFWLWLTALVSLALYVPLFFCLRGNIAVGEKQWWRIRFRSITPRNATTDPRSNGKDEPRVHKNPAREAFFMLLYPFCYVVLVLPLSIGRWISFVIQARQGLDPNDVTQTIPSAATLGVLSVFGLSGLINVMLLIMTRPGLLLLNEPEIPQASLGPLAFSEIRVPENGGLRSPNIFSQ
ncbi:hypothetical protein K439DRAFT_76324 [Ramaria rubella]|nr:hypothetical protein K439DRAFT_76324 [Ramaria rubella]